MTTNEHFQPGSGRHTGLIEDQNARLVPLRGAERREVGGSDSFVDLNPKFLGELLRSNYTQFSFC